MRHNDFCMKTDSTQCTCDREDYISSLEAERDALKAELDRMAQAQLGYYEEIKTLKAEVEVVREVSGNRLELWLTVCKNYDQLKAELDRMTGERNSMLYAVESWKNEAKRFEELAEGARDALEGFFCGITGYCGKCKVDHMEDAKDVLRAFDAGEEKK